MAVPQYGISVAPFTCNTAAGNQTITIPVATGLTPKAVMFFISRATATDTITNTQMIGGGIRAGSTSLAFAIEGDHNISSTLADTGVRADSANVIELTLAVNEGREAAATFDSFNTDNCIINWTTGTVPAAAYKGFAIFFWGADLSVNLQAVAGNATDGNSTDSSALGFDPDGLIAVSVNRAFSAGGSGADAIFSIGWAGRLPSVTQSCSAGVAEDRQDPSSGGCITRDDCVAIRLLSTAGTVTDTPRLEASFGTDKYTLTTRGASASLTAAVLSYSLGGRRVWCGAQTVGTNTTGNKSLTTPGFHVGTAILSGVQGTTLNTIVNTTESLTVGASSGRAGESANVSATWQDNIAGPGATVAKSRTGTTFYGLVGGGGGATDIVLSWVSFDLAGLTLNVDSTLGTDRPISFCLWEEPALVRGDTENISDAHVARISQASGDTERIGDAHAVKAAQASADTERISDAHVAKIAQASADTERIADSPAFKAAQASGDTERISDSPAFKAAQASGDTESISDGHVLVVFAAVFFTASDTEDITDAFVMVVSATSNAVLVSDDTLDIFEATDLVAHATLVVNDTENISDAALLYLGRLIISADTITITDGFGGTRITLRRAIQRARIEAGGAEIGIVIGPHSARGVVDG
jgi:hypothetical protein